MGRQTGKVSPTPSRNQARSPVQPRRLVTRKKKSTTPSGSGRHHPTGSPQRPGPLASRPFPGTVPAQSGARWMTREEETSQLGPSATPGATGPSGARAATGAASDPRGRAPGMEIAAPPSPQGATQPGHAHSRHPGETRGKCSHPEAIRATSWGASPCICAGSRRALTLRRTNRYRRRYYACKGRWEERLMESGSHGRRGLPRGREPSGLKSMTPSGTPRSCAANSFRHGAAQDMTHTRWTET